MSFFKPKPFMFYFDPFVNEICCFERIRFYIKTGTDQIIKPF